MAGDLEMLLDMGFEKARAEIAVKKTGSLQDAIDWLEKNQDKSLDDINAEMAENAEAGPSIDPSDTAKSLICNDCQKRFRDAGAAEFHATKSGHMNFSESTEEIRPLTEEEKKAKLEELRAKLAAKRAVSSEQDKIDKKRNEEIRRKATKESQDIKEELQKKERIKEAQAKRRERLEEVEARKRVQAKIEADKAERKRKAEEEKAKRQGINTQPSQPAQQPDAPPGPPKSAATASETRLRLQTPDGSVMKTFPADTTLFEVAHALAEEKGIEVQTFSINFPRKTFDRSDFGQTLREAGLVPSAALIVR